MSPRTSVAIVVVNFGSTSLLDANLTPLSIECPWVQVVVVDNYSSLAERHRVEALAAQRGWTLESPADNLGFGRGMNLGVERAFADGASVVVMLNPDAVVTGEQLQALIDRHTASPDSLISPMILRPDGRPWFRGSIVDLSTGHLKSGVPSNADELAWLSGACLVVGREVWDAVGGFDEDYFLYWEDVDLSVRATRAGVRLVVADDVAIVHDEGGTQHDVAPADQLSDTYYYFNIRNRIVFARKNLTAAQRRRWAIHTISESYEILLRGNGRRIFLRPWKPVALAVRGVWAGYTAGRFRPVRKQSDPGPRRVLVAHPGSELYGSDRVLADSVSAMIAHGWTVDVALPGTGALNADLIDRGAEVHVGPAPVLRKSILKPAGLVRFLADAAKGVVFGMRLVRAVDPDVVYVSTVTIPLWLLIARVLRRSTVCHVHEAEQEVPLPVRRAMMAPASMATEVVVNSEFCRDVLLESVPALVSRCHLVTNPVSGPVNPSPARSTIDGAVRLLYLGRLSPRKGPDLVIDAAAILARKGRPVHVDLLGAVFTGYEWFEDELRRSAAELEGQVDFLGFRPDVWPAIADADIVVVPSVMSESFGNTAVEAVLGARPVVVSSSGGLIEAAAGYRSATVVPVGDASAIADAVVAMIDDWAVYRSAAVNDAQTARTRHSMERFGEQLATVLDEAVSGGDHPS